MTVKGKMKQTLLLLEALKLDFCSLNEVLYFGTALEYMIICMYIWPSMHEVK
jgi:hypothetical protein